MGQNNVTPSSSSTSLAVTGFEASSPPPLLLPGEVVKSSGRYTVGQGLGPTKISGKNCFKEEVVIRNADSGKGPSRTRALKWVSRWLKRIFTYMSQLWGSKVDESIWSRKLAIRSFPSSEVTLSTNRPDYHCTLIIDRECSQTKSKDIMVKLLE